MSIIAHGRHAVHFLFTGIANVLPSARQFQTLLFLFSEKSEKTGGGALLKTRALKTTTTTFESLFCLCFCTMEEMMMDFLFEEEEGFESPTLVLRGKMAAWIKPVRYPKCIVL